MGPNPILVVKKNRGGRYNGNAASESLLVYTYVSSPRKESTCHFSEAKFKPPKCLFHFICFQLATCISWFVQRISFCFPINSYILEIFRLDISQISFNLVKKASATWQLAFLPLASRFATFWLRQHRNQNVEMRKWPTCSDWPSNGFAWS